MSVPNSLPKAETLYRRALAIQERLLPPEDAARVL